MGIHTQVTQDPANRHSLKKTGMIYPGFIAIAVRGGRKTPGAPSPLPRLRKAPNSSIMNNTIMLSKRAEGSSRHKRSFKRLGFRMKQPAAAFPYHTHGAEDTKGCTNVPTKSV